MWKAVFALATAYGTINVRACGGYTGNHGDAAGRSLLAERQQPSAISPTSLPARPLEWGDLNILHTTDTHGWLLGHLKSPEPEPNYSGDFGDFQSFVLRMKDEARRREVDLLIVDSGDLHDGNGLADNEPIIHPGSVVGHTVTQKYFPRVPYDVLAIGNHELYQLAVAQDMHDNFAPLWNGRYLSSNVNITTSGISVPIGNRVAYFRTERGRRVTAFGILYDFTGNANGTIVQPPVQMINEAWFQEAIRKETDIFILAGHMAVADDDWQTVFNAVRVANPQVPIIILGGHEHIRDCRQFDTNSMSLASGRYMETIGFMSVKGLGSENVTWSRRYLDQNRNTYEFHTSGFAPSLDTPQGIRTTRSLSDTAIAFNLSYSFGAAPMSYYANRVEAAANNSVGTLLGGPGGVLETVVKNGSRPNPPLVILNSGGIRFDIYEGNFTVNDQYIVLPFTNRFVFVPDVPRAAATQVLDLMNSGGADRRSLNSETALPERRTAPYKHGEVEPHYQGWLKRQYERQGSTGENPLAVRQAATYGYVTEDSCPGQGDDTVHTTMPYFDQPDYVGTATPDADLVDVVFVDFIEGFILTALNRAQSERTYTAADVQVYLADVLANQILGLYATAAWTPVA